MIDKDKSFHAVLSICHTSFIVVAGERWRLSLSDKMFSVVNDLENVLAEQQSNTLCVEVGQNTTGNMWFCVILLNDDAWEIGTANGF